MSTNNKSLLFANWLIHRENEFDITTVFPDSANSNIQKRIAQTMIEDAFELEDIDSGILNGAYNSNTSDVAYVDASFNYEISKRVIEELEDRKKSLSSIYWTGFNLQNDEMKWQLLQDAERIEFLNSMKTAKDEIVEIDSQIDAYSAIMSDKSVINDFYSGTLGYVVPAYGEKFTIAKKTEGNLFDGVMTASELLAKIEEAIKKIDGLIARCDSLLGINDPEIIQETAEVEVALGSKMVEEIKNERAVVMDYGNIPSKTANSVVAQPTPSTPVPHNIVDMENEFDLSDLELSHKEDGHEPFLGEVLSLDVDMGNGIFGVRKDIEFSTGLSKADEQEKPNTKPTATAVVQNEPMKTLRP